MWQEADDFMEPVRLYQPSSSRPRKSKSAYDSHIGGHASDESSPKCPKCEGSMHLLVQLKLENFMREEDDAILDRILSVHICPKAKCFEALKFGNGFATVAGGDGNAILVCRRSAVVKDLSAMHQGFSQPTAPTKSGWYADGDGDAKKASGDGDDADDDDDWGIGSGDDGGNAASDVDLEKEIAQMELNANSTATTTTKKESKPSSKAANPPAAAETKTEQGGAFDCFGLNKLNEPPAPRQLVDEDDVGLSANDEKIRNMLARYMAEEDDEEILSALKGTEMGSGKSKGGAVSGEQDERLAVEDRILLGFQDRMKRAPRQVVRYAKGGVPLWSIPSQKDGTENESVYNVPKCYCGKTREFEFQLLPSLLHVLSVDRHSGVEEQEEMKLDSMMSSGVNWGSVAVYTCPDSCDQSSEEVVVVQQSVDAVPVIDSAAAADRDQAPAALAVVEDLDDDDEFEPDA